MTTFQHAASRRNLLRFLAASPLLSSVAPDAWGADDAALRVSDPMNWTPFDPNAVIKSPKDAINVFDFEAACRENVPPAHFGYMISGVDGETTLRANRADFQKFQLVPRRLNDVAKVDMRVNLFGTTWDSPIYTCPIGGAMAYHPDAELAVSRATRAGNHMQMLSTHANTPIGEAIKARGAPVWFQLYPSNSWEIAKILVQRAENAGSPVVAVTIDSLGGRKQEPLERLRRIDTRTCSDCHDNSSQQTSLRRKRNWEGIDVAALGMQSINGPNLTWDFVGRLRAATKMKILLKGIVSAEDAELCVKYGVDGLIVSNHGGRAEETGRSTIDALPEIIAAVGGRIPVFVDSGFRRGADVVKALAMGAAAVGIGRPYIWGLGAFGQEGVERVLQIIHAETRSMVMQCGAASVKQLTPAHVRRISA